MKAKMAFSMVLLLCACSSPEDDPRVRACIGNLLYFKHADEYDLGRAQIKHAFDLNTGAGSLHKGQDVYWIVIPKKGRTIGPWDHILDLNGSWEDGPAECTLYGDPETGRWMSVY